MYGEPKLLVLNEYPRASCFQFYPNNWMVESDTTESSVCLGQSKVSEDDAWRKAAEYVDE